MLLEMGFETEESMNVLSASDWDPSRAVELLCDKVESPKCNSVSAQRVLESATVQSYLSDPEVFMSKFSVLLIGRMSKF